jgi:DNA-binding Xre family transcriptional regulator
MMRLRRRVAYQWRLREVMATRGLFTTTELVPLLAERGITLSASQVHRLVTGTPERLSLPVLAALCDILDVSPAELIATRAENVAPRTAVAGESSVSVVELAAALRPKRAHVRPEGESRPKG